MEVSMALDDSVKESMSAVMDGEGTSMDVARVLRAVKAQSVAREYWQRLQAVSSVMRTGQAPEAIDISEAVLSAIEESPAKRRVGPLGSMAVAASVTFAVVFGGSLLGTPEAGLPVATVPGVVVPMRGVSPVQASYGAGVMPPAIREPARTAPNPSVSEVYERLAREQLLRFGRRHAGWSAGVQPVAAVPYARLPSEVEQD
jgi:sigma-E factor negative regulatory protein RseA